MIEKKGLWRLVRFPLVDPTVEASMSISGGGRGKR